MTTLRLRGGRVFDPANGIDGEVRDIAVRDGRIAALDPREPVDQEIDAAGCILMAGGVDLHSHIGGGKMNLARLLMPEDHRRGISPVPLPDNALELASCGLCTPGTLATGYRYAEMGYTSVFEPAMVASNARQAHMEMGDIPIVDHGAYVMLGNDELFLRLLSAKADPQRLRDYVGWVVHATKALGVKVVNPAGISAFKFNQRRLDVDEAHTHWQVTPRQVVGALSRAVAELGLAHPLHIHASNLGVAGNIDSTLATMAALEGLPGHLTHVQFHSYGTEGPKKFSSAALQLAEAVNAHPNVSIDVGQILFGQTVTASADTMRQHANAHLASPRKWIGADIECDAGCGVVPFRYREESYVNALQWSIGLELFLLVRDPWRIVLTTDHPNGAPFTSYPHLIRLLMDKGFRDEQLAKLHPDVAAQSALREIRRELSLYEIAIMTRAAPARLLGLRDRGQLGIGAAADVAVYREQGDPEAMFSRPAWVLKDGVPVVRDGRVVATPTGATHFAQPSFDPGIERVIESHTDRPLGLHKRHAVIGRDELCRCCNGGRLLPSECFARSV
ncbi:formylmethanofuran dehydrogenase subunit A [Piscinibacter sp. XHJ-5]|uniref:formylmethanofuran dehydrogenase subunit A n=1 Tax=Piscinibacter sp. XHJ-5 TaxID=3037797 RepID=UPI002452CE6B|nr:formylmethanofuran dehydrogenase subunit A [Piscinibacter sp. XHJ-5]